MEEEGCGIGLLCAACPPKQVLRLDNYGCLDSCLCYDPCNVSASSSFSSFIAQGQLWGIDRQVFFKG